MLLKVFEKSIMPSTECNIFRDAMLVSEATPCNGKNDIATALSIK
jgi:hypothetical protein